MSYGFRAFNVDNIIQIDERYQNYYVLQKGSAVTPATLTFPDDQGQTLVFIRPHTYGDWFCERPMHNVLYNQMAVHGVRGTTSGNYGFDYVVCRIEGGPPPGNNYGLNVYNESGLLAFSSEYEYLKFVGFGLVESDYGQLVAPYGTTLDRYVLLGATAPYPFAGTSNREFISSAKFFSVLSNDFVAHRLGSFPQSTENVEWGEGYLNLPGRYVIMMEI